MWRVLFVYFCAILAVAIAAPSAEKPEGRVVGGEDAATGQFPHQISLRYRGSHICGGSIISRTRILTAAHCVTDRLPNDTLVITPAESLSIRAGTLDRFSGGMLINVVEVIVHEDYTSFWNDAAILKLEQPLIFSSQIRAIPLASKDTPPGSEVIISGWGLLWHQGDLPRMMQWNTLSAISKLSCATNIGVFQDSMLCLAHAKDNGACNGDSGGPAIYNNEIVGIAGFVVNGCGSSRADGYARVYYHREWIIKNAQL